MRLHDQIAHLDCIIHQSDNVNVSAGVAIDGVYMTFDIHSDKAGLDMGSSIVIMTGTLRRGVPFSHNLDAVFHVLTYCSDVIESDEGEVLSRDSACTFDQFLRALSGYRHLVR